MWNVMVFGDENHTMLVRVLQLRTVKDIGSLVHLPASTVSNFYHRVVKIVSRLQPDHRLFCASFSGSGWVDDMEMTAAVITSPPQSL